MKLKRQTYLKPRPLKKGSKVALAAPSSHFRKEHFDEIYQYLVSYGYDVCFDEGIFAREHYLAGSDQRRWDELQKYLKDPSIDAIFLLRGGFGAARMFHFPIKKFKVSHPKFILGMSDHTFLLNYISRHSKITTFHMPIITSELFRSLPIENKNNLLKTLEARKNQILQPPEYQVLQSGNAQGKLWGGNMSILQTTFGTPFENSWNKSILFLEDNNEMEYRMDRIFAHFYLTGHFKKIAGLVLGDFTDKENNPHSMEFLQRLIERYVPKKIPVLAQLKVGHRNGNMILPIGGEVKIQNSGNTLRIDSLV